MIRRAIVLVQETMSRMAHECISGAGSYLNSCVDGSKKYTLSRETLEVDGNARLM